MFILTLGKRLETGHIELSGKLWLCSHSCTTLAATYPKGTAAANSFWKHSSRVKSVVCLYPSPFSPHPMHGDKKRECCVHTWMLVKTSEWSQWQPHWSAISYSHCCGDVSHKEAGRPNCFTSPPVNSPSIEQPVVSYCVWWNYWRKGAEYFIGDVSISDCGTKAYQCSLYW